MCSSYWPRWVHNQIFNPRVPGAAHPSLQAILEPLSERELEVLRLLRNRIERARNCAGIGCIRKYAAHSHQKHIQQAGGEQPPGGRPAGGRARSVVEIILYDPALVGIDNAYQGFFHSHPKISPHTITSFGDDVSPH